MAKKVGKLASRYSKALLFACEKELGKDGSPTPAQKIAEELRSVIRLWDEDEVLAQAITSPMFPEDQRSKALEALAKELGLSEQASKFLTLLFERGRISALPEMVESFSVEADVAAEVVRVEVTTARVIPLEESKGIEKTIKEHIGGRPVFSWEIKPEIIGGLVLKFGGQVLDGSLQGRLKRIERDLNQNLGIQKVGKENSYGNQSPRNFKNFKRANPRF